MTKELKLKDSGVIFDADQHTYHYKGKELKGITGTLINRAYPKADTYKDVNEAVLQHAAERGTACHQSVGNYYTVGFPSIGYEDVTEEAVKLLESKELAPVKFEYIVTDYKDYASPIDIVCTDADGNICIVDMKFTSKLLYEQVQLQTSIYKRFFSIVNPMLKAERLFVLHIHTNDRHEVLDSGIFELPAVDDKEVDDLIAADREDTPFDVTYYMGELPSQVAKYEDYIAELTAAVEAKEAELKAIKDGLCQLMLTNGVKKYESKRLILTAVTPKPRQTFDTTAFKKEHADLYSQYIRTAESKPSVRLTLKG